MATAAADDRIVCYADYVCPFCYLGRTSLERYREEREEPLAVEWHPFDLRAGKRNADGSIDHDADDGKDDAYFEQARRNVRRLQDEYDVEMAQELAIEVDSLPAQLASFFVAREHPGTWLAFDAAIYEALWVDGRDIGDPDVLVDLAADVGLSESELRDRLEDDELRDRLEERFDEARRTGITGVPAFVFEGRIARGAVPPEHLRRLVEQ